GPWAIGRVESEPSPVPDQAELKLAITRLLQGMASTSPIVLIFEDLQWADPASISLIEYAASSLADSPVGFLLTWRESDLAGGPTASGLRAFSRLPNLIRIDLAGLDDRAAGDLAASLGRPLPAAEISAINRRCDGNPLFIRELVAGGGVSAEGCRRRSTLSDTVMDRVERLHSAAAPVLAAAALFRAPFTADELAPLCDAGPDTVQEVLSSAVRADVLREVDPTDGSYRFRQTLIAEVLAAGQLAVDRARHHEAIGHHLLETGGPSYEVAHHLSKSPSPDDRLLAARTALAQFHRQVDARMLAELDDYIGIGAAAVERLEGRGPRRNRDQFGIDALGYFSWRAWVDGQPIEWLENGRQCLWRALEHASVPAGRAATRTKGSTAHEGHPQSGQHRSDDEPVERLERATMNMIGFPAQPVGATRTSSFIALTGEDVEKLGEAIERLGADSPARWAAQIHLAHLNAFGKPGPNGRAKALRDVVKSATTARRRLKPDGSATVLKMVVTRFYDAMEPEARLSMLSDIDKLAPGTRTKLFVTRYAYPTLLELGRTYEAERDTEATLLQAAQHGDPFLLSEARLLWIRHLIWAGQLDVADEELDRALADWTGLGLPEPVPLVRQRRTLRLLRRTPLGRGHGPDSHHQLLVDRVGAPELAMRLAKMGDNKRAIECLEALLGTATIGHSGLSDLALMAAAAALVGHEKAAVTTHDLLVEHGDEPVVRPDGSVIFGPASLYAGLAARAAGREADAARLFEAGLRAVRRYGGSPTSVEVIVNDFDQASTSNRLPTNS
ncbi:MAG: hypothetical protein ACR2QK_21210, partial [Acidimicrobiales bacterium]